ncbi:uncharacterized protein [Euphorbia lathyris]|uniref:uncharacterized protein isoform X2 n=1 Tax=Euphorbia lathyris TaxID=212925 RepID=UPI003313CB83
MIIIFDMKKINLTAQWSYRQHLCDLLVLRQLSGVNFVYGKSVKSNKKRNREQNESSRIQPNTQQYCSNNEAIHFEDADSFLDESIENCEESRPCLWKKRSIFFDLPYWEFNLLRHNLDVMHIEKNICDNLLGTFLNLDGKSKDNYKTRLDLIDMGIRHELHPTAHNGSRRLPQACYTMSSVEKELFLTVLKNMKVPDGYASNISRCVNLKERKIINLKSHDCHVLMQDILPIALRSTLPRQVVAVVTDLCSIFKGLCSKTLDPNELDLLESKVAETLCRLEKTFLPSFFTIMVHLTIHLVAEVKLVGLVYYRWLFPIERLVPLALILYVSTLIFSILLIFTLIYEIKRDLVQFKANVRNKAHPEGSIAEGYVADECLTFCSRYFQGVETNFNRPQRNFDRVNRVENYMFSTGRRTLGKIESAFLDEMSFAQIHRYVLLHYDQICTYRSEFLAAQRRAYRPSRSTQRIEQKWLIEKFPEWLVHQQNKYFMYKIQSIMNGFK